MRISITGPVATTINSIASHRRQHPDTEYPWDEEDWPATDIGIEELWEALGHATEIRQAAAVLEARLRDLMLTDIQEHGSIVLGPTVYFPKRNTTLEWADPDTSPRAVLSYALKGAGSSHRAVIDRVLEAVRFGPREVRRSWLHAQAALRAGAGDKEEIDEAKWGIDDTFFDRQESDTGPRYVLGSMATGLDRAPKWAKALGHGERRP